MEEIRQIKKQHEDSLFTKKNVVGVAIGYKYKG
jgi:hypothetical protein